MKHNKVPREIAHIVDKQRLLANQGSPTTSVQSVNFVREGQSGFSGSRKRLFSKSLLDKASDWELLVDLDKKLIFPQDVLVTNLRPDMVLCSRLTKTIVIIELTVPWEDRLSISNSLKRDRYQDLADEVSAKGWIAHLHPVEMGCRGFPATSLHSMFQRIGLTSCRLKRALKNISGVTESCSRWL